MESLVIILAIIFLIAIAVITIYIEAMYWKSFFDFIKALFSLFNKKQ